MSKHKSPHQKKYSPLKMSLIRKEDGALHISDIMGTGMEAPGASAEIYPRIEGKSFNWLVDGSNTQEHRPAFVEMPVTFDGGIQTSAKSAIFLRTKSSGIQGLKRRMADLLLDLLSTKDNFASFVKAPVSDPRQRRQIIKEMLSVGSLPPASAGVNLSRFLTKEEEDEVLRPPGDSIFLDRAERGGLKCVFKGLDGNRIQPKNLEGKTFTGDACFQPRSYPSQEGKQFKIDLRLISVLNITFEGAEGMAQPSSRKRPRDDPEPVEGTAAPPPLED
jgi:hypothetical protein